MVLCLALVLFSSTRDEVTDELTASRIPKGVHKRRAYIGRLVGGNALQIRFSHRGNKTPTSFRVEPPKSLLLQYISLFFSLGVVDLA